ncbi:MAG TPA: hypothetical protein PLS46_13185 [Microthrixaceae bacterium]|nr:hypothetical protein [Microthrixaceae bacterium]
MNDSPHDGSGQQPDRRRIARAPWADADTLVGLLDDPDGHTRIGALANPNTPRSARLAALARFGLDETNDIEAAGPSSHEQAWMMAHADATDPARQRFAVVSADSAIAHRLADNPALDRVVAAVLAGSPDWTVRQRLATAGAPVDLLETMAIDEHPRVRQAVANRADAPAAALALLLNDPDARVRMSVARRPELDPHSVMQLARDPDRGVARLIARRGDLPPEAIAALAGNTRGAIRREVVARVGSSLPSTVVEALAGDPVPSVRSEVARIAALPDDLLVRLVSDPDPQVGLSAMRGRSLSPDQVRQALSDASPPVAAALYRQHADELDVAVLGFAVQRVVAAGHPISAGDASVLVDSPDVEVRRRLAGNPSSPVPVLVRLASDPDRDCHRRARRNASLPVDALTPWLHDSDPHARRAAFEHPEQTVTGRLALAARFGQELVSTSVTSVDELTRSTEPADLSLAVVLGGETGVLSNGAAPAPVLRTAWASVRDRATAEPIDLVFPGGNLARHPNLPADLLDELMATELRGVHRWLAHRDDLSTETVRRLVARGAADVDVALLGNPSAHRPDLDPPLRLGSRSYLPPYRDFLDRGAGPVVDRWRVHATSVGPSGRRVEMWTDLGTDGDDTTDDRQWQHLGVAIDPSGRIVSMLGLRSTALGPELVLFDGGPPRSLDLHPRAEHDEVFLAAALGVLGEPGQRLVTAHRASVFESHWPSYYRVAGSFVGVGLQLVAPERGGGSLARKSSSEPLRVVTGRNWTLADGTGAATFVDEAGAPVALLLTAAGEPPTYQLHLAGGGTEPRPGPDMRRTGPDWLTLEIAQDLANRLSEADRSRPPSPRPTPIPPPTPPDPLPVNPVELPRFRMPEWEALTQDPASGLRAGDARWIRTRMSAHPLEGWSAAGSLLLTGPTRTASPDAQIFGQELIVLPDNRGYLLHDEQRLRFHARRIRRHSLDPDPTPMPMPMLSRLRALHLRTLPEAPAARACDWYPTSGVNGVLDRFGGAHDGPLTAFQLSAVLGDEEGLVVSGSGPAGRAQVVHELGIPLAGSVVVDDLASSGFWWRCPDGFTVTEQLDFSTPTLTAFAELEAFAGSTDEWRDTVFRRGPFLRDAVTLVDRVIDLEGFGPVRIERFDWQPPASDRLVTTLAHGVAGGLGFWFAMHIALHAPDAALLAQPDALLTSIRVE